MPLPHAYKIMPIIETVKVTKSENLKPIFLMKNPAGMSNNKKVAICTDLIVANCSIVMPFDSTYKTEIAPTNKRPPEKRADKTYMFTNSLCIEEISLIGARKFNLLLENVQKLQ
ncbi:MAG TPA: hypothetical protein VLG76_04040 [Rhabdochlamydiaceae bacterium]|nr:hypothetical protein [Rhabdochlamydiaceae bacterium]HSX37829.1 hypothetical protein [Chlamydiales bacterium]